MTTLDEAGRTKTAATVVISVICVVFLLIVKQINERYQKKYLYGIPIPGEIVVVSEFVKLFCSVRKQIGRV